MVNPATVPEEVSARIVQVVTAEAVAVLKSEQEKEAQHKDQPAPLPLGKASHLSCVLCYKHQAFALQPWPSCSFVVVVVLLLFHLLFINTFQDLRAVIPGMFACCDKPWFLLTLAQ